jgi:hypothetical protein
MYFISHFVKLLALFPALTTIALAKVVALRPEPLSLNLSDLNLNLKIKVKAKVKRSST